MLEQGRGEGDVPTTIWPVAAITIALLSVEASAQGNWTQMKPIPQGANEVIGAAVGGRLYVYGGERVHTQHVYGGVNLRTQPLGMFSAYDPKTDTWTRLKPNPVPVHHGAAAAIGKKFYVFGGFRLPDTGRIGWYPEDKAWVYDTETQIWSELPPMPTPRGAHAAVSVDNKIYVIGGAKIPSGMDLPDGLTPGGPIELLGTMEAFDTEKNTWTVLKPMTLPRNHHDVAYLDGKLYVIGGSVGSCFPRGWASNVSMNEVYDIATDTWSTRAPMPTARSGVGAVVIDGKIYVIGGEGWVDELGGVFRTNEAYNPKSESWVEKTPMPTARHGFAKGVLDGKLYAVSGVSLMHMFSVVAVNEVYTP
jgi:N-acetylneuraminic acid mutarotase